MNNNKCPCYGCTDRSITCHDECKKYIDWKTERDAIRDKESKERALKGDISALKTSVIERVRAKKR